MKPRHLPRTSLARLTILFWVFSLLAACSLGQQTPTPSADQPNPQAIFTAAAATAQARLTEGASITRTPPSPTPTETPAPTEVITPTATTPAPTVNPAGQTPTVAGTNVITFVSDVTVPDGTTFKPGEKFTKTWRLQNSGTATWTTAYSLVFYGGEQMGAPASIPLPLSVAPGASIDLSVELTAPLTAGKYTSYWMLRTANGLNFGLGGRADAPFYTVIIVDGAAATPGTPAPTGTENTTPTPTQSGSVVVSASLVVDEADVTAACPHTFTFNAEFAINKAVKVTYQLEAETGFPINLPAPTTIDLGPGVHKITYTLAFTDDVQGWARFHVTAPDDLRSQQVNFTLNCE